MSRITRFEELPTWLQHRLEADWAALQDEVGHVAVPPIRDPEYRVYRVDDTGWWVVDAGTGGVTVERENEAHAVCDLADDSELGRLVAAYGSKTRAMEARDYLTEIILRHGVDPRALMAVARVKPGSPDDEVERILVGVLYAGLTLGQWPA